jgi:hypothetical protein
MEIISRETSQLSEIGTSVDDIMPFMVNHRRMRPSSSADVELQATLKGVGTLDNSMADEKLPVRLVLALASGKEEIWAIFTMHNLILSRSCPDVLWIATKSANDTRIYYRTFSRVSLLTLARLGDHRLPVRMLWRPSRRQCHPISCQSPGGRQGAFLCRYAMVPNHKAHSRRDVQWH